MTNDNDLPELLPTERAAAWLSERTGGVGKASTLRRMRSTGGGPRFVLIGGRNVRYRPQDLEAWVRERISEPIPNTASAPGWKPRPRKPAQAAADEATA